MKQHEHARLAELKRYEILDTPPEACFDRLTQLAARTCRVPIALITLVDEQRLWIKSAFGLAANETARQSTLCAETILGAGPLICRDASQDPRFNQSSLVMGEPGIRFYAGVPLTNSAGFALGTLCIIDRAPRNISEEETDTLKILAAQVLQQFELHRIAETLRRQSNSLERTQAIAQIGGWELDLDTQTLSWSAETYRIHDLTPEDYVPDVASAISFYSAASAVQIRHAVKAVIESGTPYDLELQLITQSGRRRWVRATGQRDAALGVHSRIYGVFQDITERRNLESEVIVIAQREQSRIGLDLHDGLGQSLTGISLLLSDVTLDVPETLPNVRQHLKEIEALVAGAIGTCRTLAHGLAPVSKERGGLLHALKQLGTQLGTVHGIQISVEIRGFGRLPESAADHLYRIAQEALTNAIRHAAAHRIQLLLEMSPAQILLEVTDDGRGLQTVQTPGGMGISIMRYRARLIGAVLSLGPAKSGGTRVTCQLETDHLGEPAREKHQA